MLLSVCFLGHFAWVPVLLEGLNVLPRFTATHCIAIFLSKFADSVVVFENTELNKCLVFGELK